MSKGMDQKKNQKKEPTKTLKEKREASVIPQYRTTDADGTGKGCLRESL